MAKRALLVGLNTYPDPQNALRGCLNDVGQMLVLLRDHYGFEEAAAIRLLTDRHATTAAIKAGLAWLVRGARAGDVLVFHYSGHGSQVPDLHGDEQADGLDEIICPYDLDWDAPFTDDDLHDAVKGVPANARLTVVLDCCHAGTGLRDVANRKCLQPPASHSTPIKPGRRTSVRRFGTKAAEAGAILVAACREEQVSADAYIDGDYHGALTYYLCNAVQQAGYLITYGELLRRLRGRLRAAGFEQEPQLEGPREAAVLPVFAGAARQATVIAP